MFVVPGDISAHGFLYVCAVFSPADITLVNLPCLASQCVTPLLSATQFFWLRGAQKPERCSLHGDFYPRDLLRGKLDV